MATNRAKKPASLGLLKVWDVALDMGQAPDDLLKAPGFMALVIDLTGRRKPVGRMSDSYLLQLYVQREELQAWLRGLRYQAAGAAA